jgi:hypothetical protein
MLTELQNDMLDALDRITAFKERGVWQGNLEDLLKQPQKTPSAHVALASGLFSPPVTTPAKDSMATLGWDVIVIYQCLKDRKISTTQGYGLIEAVVKPVSKDPEIVGGLTGLKTQGGMLWPVSLDLLDTVNGISAYAIRFEIKREIK